ncbi:MAG: transcription termination/antitermination factor NusG [Oscillospiraceae bacterium]|nr:transcription termination/antitermination factor NusG [Oscillospiraceae bacterium]MBQ9858819.1 transcription termination/antitermination factor NusG [Oscillospiraceae bacterium]
MSESARWYVIHTYSGYENAVATTIEKAVENRKMQDLILEVNIPMETVEEVSGNQTKVVERKVFPGYVLVKMVMTDESWLLVRNVRGVTGFVGSANKAIPLTDEEVFAMGVEKREVKVGFDVGSTVKVTDGPLDGFLGTVDEIDIEKERVRVIVSMFGRETPVDLEFDQIETVDE